MLKEIITSKNMKKKKEKKTGKSNIEKYHSIRLEMRK